MRAIELINEILAGKMLRLGNGWDTRATPEQLYGLKNNFLQYKTLEEFLRSNLEWSVYEAPRLRFNDLAVGETFKWYDAGLPVKKVRIVDGSGKVIYGYQTNSKCVTTYEYNDEVIRV